MSWKISLLVTREILGLFVNTSTADEKYSPRNSENLPQPIQMQLSKKLKRFSRVFAAFRKFTSNKYFLKKGGPCTLWQHFYEIL